MTLLTEKRTLLTIITEAAIEQPILRDAEQLGITGYTVSDARGRGRHGLRDAAWDETANIRIDVICTRAQAEQVLTHIKKRYYPDYAMMAFLQEAEILLP